MELADVSPRQLGCEAASGQITAGPMSLVDYLRLQEAFERITNLGVAVRGRSGSALLFSQKPIRQLEDATIAVTDETSTTALLLRLILEVRYERLPRAYQRGVPTEDVDACLLIGDEALTFRATNRRFPYETDLAFEWWLWQHLPFVFAVWAIRKETSLAKKQRLTRALFKAVSVNAGRLDILAQQRAETLGMPVDDLHTYLANFIYRLSDPEEEGIKRFEALAHDHRLL